MPTLLGRINNIVDIVGEVVSATDSSISQSSNPALQEQTGSLLKSLSDSRDQLQKANAESEKVPDEEAWKEFIGKLPPLGFAMVRETKELVRRIEQVEFEAGSDDDFA